MTRGIDDEPRGIPGSSHVVLGDVAAAPPTPFSGYLGVERSRHGTHYPAIVASKPTSCRARLPGRDKKKDASHEPDGGQSRPDALVAPKRLSGVEPAWLTNSASVRPSCRSARLTASKLRQYRRHTRVVATVSPPVGFYQLRRRVEKSRQDCSIPVHRRVHRTYGEG